MRKILTVAVLLAVLGGGVAYATVHGTYQGYPVVKVVVNGRELQPDVPAIVMEGRTLLPVRAIAEALGAQVAWDQNSMTATVNTLLSDAETCKAVSEIVQPIEDLMKQQVASKGPKGKEDAQKLQVEALTAILRLRELPLGGSDRANTVREVSLGYLWSLVGFGACTANAFTALEARDIQKADEQKVLSGQFAEAAKAFGQVYHSALRQLQEDAATK